MQSVAPIQRILIVEPNDTESGRLAGLLADLGVPCGTAKTASQAIYSLRSSPVDIIFCDQGVPGLDQFDLLPQLQRAAPGVPVILTVAVESPAESKSQAPARGAWEVMEQPVQPACLELVLQRAGVARNLRRHVEELEAQLIERCAHPPLAGSSPSMIGLLEDLERAASSHRPTLLEGEPGTNKESIARALHDLSAHRAGPFVALRCRRGGSSPGQTGRLEDPPLTFPSRRGDPSVLAAGGTLFLADIERLSLSQQAEVFRLIEDDGVSHTVPRRDSARMRVVISTHTDLEESVRSGTFLKELHEILSQNRLQVPALRNRREDIPLLADHWCRVFAGQLGRVLLGINDQAMSQLIGHSWPGNLRELEAVLRLAVSRAESDRITPADLPLDLFDASTQNPEDPARNPGLKNIRQRAEAKAIRQALSATHGNRTHAAKLLQISHRALLYKLKAYEIRD